MHWDWVVVFACCLLAAVTGCGSSSTTVPASSKDASVSLADAAPDDLPCSESPGVPSQPCGCQGECVAGAQCRSVFGPPSTGWTYFHVCTAIASGVCAYGAIIEDRCTGGAFCLRSNRGDAPGLCLTPVEKAGFCLGSLADAFACDSYGSKDAGGPGPDGVVP